IIMTASSITCISVFPILYLVLFREAPSSTFLPYTTLFRSVRISASEWHEGGFDITEAAEVCRDLSEAGVDLIDVSSGGNYPVQIPIGPGYQVPLAAAIRAEGVPTGAVGLITDPKQAETILSTAQADAIFMARAALREPAWPQRAAHILGVEPGPYPPQYTRGAW